MKLRLIDYNTYMDTDGGVHDAEFKELDEARLHGFDPWDAILWCASDQSSEEDLSWALVDKTA